MQKQQPNRKVLLFLATLAVLAGIVWGALFLIAPIWQPGTPVAYMPALPADGSRRRECADTAGGPEHRRCRNLADPARHRPGQSGSHHCLPGRARPLCGAAGCGQCPRYIRANDRKMGRPGTDGNARRKGTINREESPWKSPRASLSTVS